MKNLKRFIGAAVLGFTLCMTSVSVHAATRKYVTADSLNVRTSPYIGDNVIKSVGYRNYVSVVAEDNGWAEIIMANGNIGWVSSNYLSDNQPPVKKISTPSTSGSKGEYLFTATRVSHYCPCSICNGKNAGKTASGKSMTPYYTCASNSLPLGTKIYLEGYGILEVQDRLSSRYGGTVIDVLVSSHSEAYAKGVKSGLKVYKVS